MPFCVHCKHPVDKISVRSSCPSCGAYLHCCLGCKHYQKGLTNDCRIAGTEQVADRAMNNFCEDFSPLDKVEENQVTKESGKKRFDDLFR